MFCTFWVGNVLRATTVCNFSSLIRPAGSAPAALASLLFDPPEPQINDRKKVFRAPGSSFFWGFLFFDLLSSSLLFSDSSTSHLCFSSVHIVGSLTSKLPSILFHLNNILINSGSTYNVESVWAAQRSGWPKKMQRIELKAKLQTISGDAVFVHLLSLHRRNMYIVY